MNLKKFGFMPADILIPADADMKKWSVVACDQYTSQPDYWKRVANTVGDSPSAYNLIFPEIYLETVDNQEKINSINTVMDEYIKGDIFREIKNSFIYVKREVTGGKIRHGIIGIVDLEAYDYNKGSKTLIRATEGTVLERIPPRVKIRINASLELPHIMLLVDDKDNILFDTAEKKCGETLYDFDLMESSGHIRGYKVEADEDISNALNTLYEACGSDNRLLFAVGDGNHSLATAKQCWEQIKLTLSDSEKENHPARYSLVELVNIHDKSLEFEPIHRVLFDCEPEKIVNDIKTYYNATDNFEEGSQALIYVVDGTEKSMYIKNAPSYLPVGTLQGYIDKFLSAIKVDYIHGADVTKKLAHGNNLGFILPPMDKGDLFKTVIADGALPRKTFSMGEACDKRFYLECRKVK